jgi:tetratricopeptide (TPR) repeat protein/Tfp pilus assembly protein PilF
MSAEKIRTALATIQQDPNEASSWDTLEEVITGDGGAEVVRELELGRVWHERLKNWDVVVKLLEYEVALDDEPSIVAAKQLELARIYNEELMRTVEAEQAYRRAGELKPNDDTVRGALGEIDFGRTNLAATVEQAMVEALDSDDDKVRVPMLVRAAEYTYRYGDGGEEALQKAEDWLGQALSLDDSHKGALALGGNIYRRLKRWDDLAKVLERRVATAKAKEDKLGAAYVCALVLRHHSEDEKRQVAAHQTLVELDPSNQLALQFLAGHYTKAEEWDHLAALYEDQLSAGTRNENEELGALVQLAMLNWRSREKPDAAEPFFERVRRAEPTHAGMLTFFRERLTENEPGRLMSILTDAQRATDNNDAKAKFAEEIASLAEGQENARRAIEQYKTILRNDPDNADARNKLKNLYLETESYNALVELLRQELGRFPDDETQARVAVLWEIAGVYRDRVQSDTSLLTVLTQILQIDETDIEAVRALLKVYESLGRWRDLLTTQQKLAELTDDAGEKLRLLRAVARRWLDQFSNAQNAISAFEALLAADNSDPEAREKLRELYQKRRAWEKLYDLYEMMLDGLEGEPRASMMGDMAKLAAERLGKGEEAIRLLKEVLVFDPEDGDVLDQLERQAERQKDFPTVAYVLERRYQAADDAKDKLSLLQKLGVLYADKIGDQDKAQGAWRRVLEHEPGHKRALRVLRQSFVSNKDWDGLTQLYSSQDDFEGLADFLSTTADKSKDEADKVTLSFRAATVYEDQLGAPERAARSYERVLTIDGGNVRAAEQLLPLYEDEEKWSRLPALHQILLDATDDVEQKIATLGRMAEITGGPLSNKAGALAHARKAYELSPNDEALEGLREWSQQAGEWSTFTDVVQAKLDDEATTPERARELKLMIASVYGAEVEKIDDAVAMYRNLLQEDPTDENTSRAFEELLRAADRRDDLRWLFELKVEQTGGETKCEALEEWATVEEEVFGEPEKAIELLRRIVSEDPSRTSALATLTRLLVTAEDYPSAARIVEKHRDATDGQARVELETRLAELYLEHLDEPTQAYEACVRALQIDQSHEPAIELLEQLLDVSDTRPRAAQALERIYGDAGEADKQVQALRAMLETVEDADRRLELCQRLADVHEHQLSDTGGAFDVILAALLEVKTDITLWDRARTLSDAAGRPTDLAEAYRRHLAQSEGAPDDQAEDEEQDAEIPASLSEELQLELSERAAILHEEALGDPEGAIPYLERMLEIDPRHASAFDRLKAIFNAVERWRDLEGLYKRTIEVTEDEAARIDLLHQAALVAEDMIGNDEQAIAYYERIVAIDSLHMQATEALERLYGREERYDKLAGLLERRLETAMDDEAAPILQQLVDLYLHQLESYDHVIGHLERCLQLDKDDHDVRALAEECLEVPQLRQAAALLLDDLYVSVDDPRDLVRVLGVRLEGAKGEDERRELLQRIAKLRDERLKDDAGAFETLCELMPLEPDDAMIRERLIDIGRRLGEADKMATALLATADKATVPAVQGEVLMEAADLFRDRLDKLDKAQEVYRRVLAIDPGDPDLVIPAAKALSEIYQEESKHEALAEVQATQVQLESDPARIREIYARIANIYEDLLENDAKAIDAWKARVAEDDNDQPALAALERLYERTEAWTELVEVLRSLERAAEDGDERKRCMVKAAEVLATELDQTEEAIDAWSAVLDDFGAEPDTLAALAKLYQKGGRWQDLGDTYETWLAETEEVDERVRLFAAVGDVRREHLEDPQGALAAYREVLTIEPSHEGARASLEKLLASDDADIKREAAEIIGPLYEADGAAERLLKVLDIEIEATYDPVGKLDTLKRALLTAEDTVGNAGRAFDYAARGVREALGEPSLGEWIDTVERLAAETERWPDLLGLYEEVLDDMLDAEVQQTVRRRAGELSRGRLEDAPRAIGHYRAALDNDADDQQAMVALEELYEEGGDNESLLEILKLRADVADSDEDRVALLFRVAELQAGPLEKRDEAIETYEELTNLSLEARAVEALETLYAKAERYDDLVGLHERVLDTVSGEAAADVRVKIARACHEKLDDSMRALDELGEALGADQDHQGAIAELEKMLEHGEDPEQRGRVAEMLEPVYLSSHDWQRLRSVLEARLEVTLDPVDRGELLARLATLYEEQLEDYGAALETVAKRLREEPTDEDIRAEVERLGRVLGDESERRVAEIFASALEEVTADEPSTASLAARTGELFASVEDNDKALSWYRRAYDFEPESKELFDAIDALLIKLQRRQERIDHYRAALDHTFEDETRVGYMHTVAALHRELEQQDEAIATLTELLDIDERNDQALDALTELFASGDRSDDLADLYERRADLADAPEASAPHRLALARLLLNDEDGKDRALDQLDIIVTDLPSNEGAIDELEKMLDDRERKQRVIDLLRPLYERAENWQGLIKLDEERLSLSADAVDQVDVLMNTASLWEDQGDNLDKAFNVARKAFLLQPDHEDARATVERLAESLECWEDLADAYTAAVEKVDDEFTRRPLLAALASVADQRLDDPRRSLNALMSLSELDPSDPEPLEQMGLLCSLLGDWDTLAIVVAKQADNAGDDERASLLRRLGGIKHDMLGQTDEAVAVYEEALDVMPDSKVTLDHLIELYEGRDAQRLVELLEQRIGVTDPSDDERHELIVRAAEVYQQKLEQPQEAIRVLQLALDERPTDRDVLGRMANLFRAEEMYDSLLENLKTQASVSEDAAERLELRNKIGDLFLAEFDNAFDALEQYRMVLEEDDENAHAIEKCQHIAENYEELRLEVAALLEPVLQAAARHGDLVAMMELRFSAQTDPSDRAQTLSGIALIQEEQLDAPESSRDTLLRALAEVPDDTHLHDEVTRLCELTGDWAKYADVLSERAEATFDALVQADLYTRLGRIAEEQLEQRDRAIEAYSRAADQAEDPAPLLEALDRLYVATESWTELGQVLERRADLAQDDGERAGLYHRLGVLQIERFDDKDQGLGTLRTAADLNAEHAGVREALEGLTDDERLFEEVAEILDNIYRVAQDSPARAKLRNKRISYAPTASDRVRLRLELAQMLEDESFDTKSAQDVIQQAMFDDATDPELLAQLERLATTNAAGEEGDAAWSRAADALGEAVAKSLDEEVESDMSAELARDLYLRSAGWYKDKVSDLDAAEKRLREALAQDDSHPETVLALEEIHRGEGREKDLVDTLRKLAALVQAGADAGDRSHQELRKEAKVLAETPLEDAELAEAILRDMLQTDDADEWALTELSAVCEAKEDHGELYRLLMRRLELMPEPVQLRELRHQAAKVAAEQLDDKEGAIDLYEQAFEDDPKDEEASAALRVLYEQLERYEDMLRFIERLLDMADTPEERAELRLESARICIDIVSAPSEGIDHLNAVLEEIPDHAGAVEQLSKMLEKEQRDDELADLLNKQIVLAQEAADQDKELGYRVQLSELYETRLNDPDKAIEGYLGVLETDKAFRPALEALARLYEQQDETAKAAEMNEKLLDGAEDGDLTRLALKAKDLFVAVDDPAAGCRVLEAVVDKADAIGADNVSALRDGLRALYRESGQWEKLAELVETEAGEAESDEDKVALFKKAAAIHSGERDDHARAAELLDKAVELDSDDRELMLLLCDEYTKSGRGQAAIEVLQKVVESYGGRRSKELADIHHRIASAHMAEGDQDAAMSELESARKMDPGSVTILYELGTLSLRLAEADGEGKAEHVKRAGNAFRSLLLQRLDAGAPVSKADVFYNLARVSQADGDKKKAKQMADRALSNDKEHAEAKALLEELT